MLAGVLSFLALPQRQKTCWTFLVSMAKKPKECFDQKIVDILPIALNEDPSRWEDVSPRLLALMA